MIFLERKGAAYIQDRPGPNRSAITLPVLGTIRGFGFVHNFSDVVKLMMKEDFIPARAHKAFYLAAPIIPVATAVLTPALIPWFADLSVQGIQVTGQAIDSHAGFVVVCFVGLVAVWRGFGFVGIEFEIFFAWAVCVPRR